MDNTAKVWETTGGAVIATLEGHSGFVGGVAFSPDGQRLATGGGNHSNGEVKIWDATQWNPKSAKR